MKFIYLVMLGLLLLAFPVQALAADTDTVTVSTDQFWSALVIVLVFLFGSAWKFFQMESQAKRLMAVIESQIEDLEDEILARTGLEIDLEAQIQTAIIAAREEFGVENKDKLIAVATSKLKNLLESPLFGGKVNVPENVIKDLIYKALAEIKSGE